MVYRIRSGVAGIVLAASAVGCTHNGDAGAAPKPNPQPIVSVNVGERLKAARALVDQTQALAARLPVQDDDEQRRVMQDVFDRLSKLLPMLMGPEADEQFRLQQRIVADAGEQMGRPENRLALEPMIDSGLRAGYNGLVRVAQESFYTNDRVTESISDLRGRVDALDRVRGPKHKEAVGDAVKATVVVMDQMVRIYDARLDRRTPETPVDNPKARSESRG